MDGGIFPRRPKVSMHSRIISNWFVAMESYCAAASFYSFSVFKAPMIYSEKLFGSSPKILPFVKRESFLKTSEIHDLAVSFILHSLWSDVSLKMHIVPFHNEELKLIIKN